MAVSKKQLLIAKVMKKNIWVAQPAKEMCWHRPTRLKSILGIMTSVYTVSEADRVLRKKYMGVWRWRSKLMMVTMMTLPARVSMYRARNTTKSVSWCSRKLEKPWKVNSHTKVWFCFFIISYMISRKKKILVIPKRVILIGRKIFVVDQPQVAFYLYSHPHLIFFLRGRAWGAGSASSVWRNYMAFGVECCKSFAFSVMCFHILGKELTSLRHVSTSLIGM